MQNNNIKDNKYLKDHNQTKLKLRKIGFICVGIGGLLLIISLVDFFAAFYGTGFPTLSFLFFIAAPLLFVGGVCLMYGYMGAVGSYVASQAAPIAKNVSNYMLDGTRDEVGKTVKHVVSSLRENNSKFCPKCNTKQDEDAKFCDNCGARLNKICSSCNTNNDDDASFCKSCGKKL